MKNATAGNLCSSVFINLHAYDISRILSITTTRENIPKLYLMLNARQALPEPYHIEIGATMCTNTFSCIYLKENICRSIISVKLQILHCEGPLIFGFVLFFLDMWIIFSGLGTWLGCTWQGFVSALCLGMCVSWLSHAQSRREGLGR